MYELSSGYLRDNFGIRVYVFYFVPSDVCLGFLCTNTIANNFIGLGGRAYPVRHYPIAIRLRDRKGRAILCVALISSEWGLFGCNTRSAIRGTSSPRSYCHPTQPILQLHSHILLKYGFAFSIITPTCSLMSKLPVSGSVII